MDILKWEKGACFVDTGKPTSKCYFDYWSILHFIITALCYIIIYVVIFKCDKRYAFTALIVTNLIHAVEDLLENIYDTNFGCWVGIYDGSEGCEIDSLQNFIGDIISGFLRSYIIYRIICYRF